MTDFERIKERVDILSVIEGETGFKMGRHHLQECPFCGGHDCFSVDRERQLYKCFQCDAAGDVFSFLEGYHKTDKAEALRRAAELAGVALTEGRRPREVKLTTRERIFIDAAEYYEGQGTDNGAKSYLVDKRGHKKETLRQMHVGWTTGGLTDHLRGKGYVDVDIKASGLAKEFENAAKERFLLDFFAKELAIFPHWDGNGKVLHFTIKDPAKKLAYQLPAEVRGKEWRFYNQAALSKYGEVIVVEGENDVLSVMDAGVQHVIGLIGTPADYQIKALKDRCAGKHLYIWVDNDDGGKGFVRKICGELADAKYNVRVIVYDQGRKDPDEYLRGLAAAGGGPAGDAERKKEIRRLQAEAVDYVTWEIAEIGREETLELRLKALKSRRIFAALGEMVEAERLVFFEKLEGIGFTRRAIEEQIEANNELLGELDLYLEGLQNKREADPNRVAGIIFRHLGKDGQFFKDREGKVYLFHRHYIYEIGNNRPYNALMKLTTRLLPTKEPGRSVWESLASEAYNFGKQIDLASWIHTDRATDTIYVNLNSQNNVILKISKASVEEIPNGLNADGVLLKSSRKILPMNFLPDAGIREGMEALRDLVFENLACEKEQRFLILCWFITAFLLDFAPYMALMKFSGATASGKTTAAKLLSLLIYGNEHLGDPSTAAMYAVSSQNPLLIVDNLESEDITKSGLKFLLLSATKGGKEKRTQGTETDTTEETPKALVLITAIEPFVKAELINRTYDVEFEFKYKSDDFIEDEVVRQVIKKRDLILSSIVRLIQKEILPNLGQRRDYITILKKEYRNHAKARTDEFMAMLMLVLEKLVKYIPFYGEDDVLYGLEGEVGTEAEIRRAWITYQDAKARDTETTTNSILKMLDGLVAEYLLRMRSAEKLEPDYHKDYPAPVYTYQHPEYGLEIIKTEPEMCTDEGGQEYIKTIVEFTATPRDLVLAFDRFCRNNGIRNPYSTAGIFGERLKNDRHLLMKGNWELIGKEGLEPYWKVVRGERFWRFRKTIIR